MAVPVLESSTNNATTAASITLTKPSGVATGDLLIILVHNDATNQTSDIWDNSTNKPTGFTFINDAGDGGNVDVHCGAFWRIADGTEGTTVAVPCAVSGDYTGFYLRLSGADGTDPIDVVGADYTSNPANAHAVTGVTTTVDDCYVICNFVSDGADLDPWSISGTGWSLGAYTEAGTGSGNTGGGYCIKTQSTAGATGTCTVTYNGGGSDGGAGFQFAIAPPAAAGATGTAAFTAPIPTQAATGTVAHTGTSAFTAPVPTQAASGTAVTAITGTSAFTALLPTQDASGTAAHTGTAAFSAPLPTQAASGSVGAQVSGTASFTAPVATQAAPGTAVTAITGTSAFTLPVPTLATSGLVARTGTGAFTVLLPTQAASGSVTLGTVSGTASFTSPVPVPAASGVSATAITGEGVFTLPIPTMEAMAPQSFVTTGSWSAAAAFAVGDEFRIRLTGPSADNVKARIVAVFKQ